MNKLKLQHFGKLKLADKQTIVLDIKHENSTPNQYFMHKVQSTPNRDGKIELNKAKDLLTGKAKQVETIVRSYHLIPKEHVETDLNIVRGWLFSAMDFIAQPVSSLSKEKHINNLFCDELEKSARHIKAALRFEIARIFCEHEHLLNKIYSATYLNGFELIKTDIVLYSNLRNVGTQICNTAKTLFNLFKISSKKNENSLISAERTLGIKFIVQLSDSDFFYEKKYCHIVFVKSDLGQSTLNGSFGEVQSTETLYRVYAITANKAAVLQEYPLILKSVDLKDNCADVTNPDLPSDLPPTSSDKFFYYFLLNMFAMLPSSALLSPTSAKGANFDMLAKVRGNIFEPIPVELHTNKHTNKHINKLVVLPEL